MHRRWTPLALSIVALAAGCGGDGGDGGSSQTTGDLPSSAALRDELQAATRPSESDFEPAGNRTLEQIAASLDGAGTSVGLATSVFVPGEQRVAFGVIDQKTGFVYGKTAVYVADRPGARARGPFLAPADLLMTDPAYRSRQSATEGDPFAAVYAAQVPLEKPGKLTLLVVTRLADGSTVGAGTQVDVIPKERDTVVAVGEPAPKVDTDTLDSAGGNIDAIETRVPADTMHATNLADVLGKRPVAVVMATPQLCTSRVCGPVVDVAEQLKATYGDRIEFIHQEVYVDNEAGKGLRRPLKAFGLHTEPWLFVMNAEGIVTARLEGSFGFDAFRSAIETGLG